MPKILITGSEGNIGAYIVQRLKKTRPDFEIIRVGHKNINDKPKEKEKIYIGDLTDESLVKKIFAENKIDYVIHAAAKSYGSAGFKEAAFDLFKNDIQALLNVLGQSRRVKKFVYLSSVLVYDAGVKTPFTEEMTEEIMPPQSSLGLTKYFGEKAVKFFNQQYGVKYTIWRPHNVVSPLESHERAGRHVFVDLYRKLFIERAPEIEIYGDGRQVRCFTWVKDIAGAMADFLDDPRTDDQIFNLGNEEPKSIIELKDILIQIGKEKNILPADYEPRIITGSQFFGVDAPLRVASMDKIKKNLGWHCQTDFKKCFEKFIEHKNKI